MTTTPEKDRCPGCPGPAIGGCGAAGGGCVAADWLRLGGEAELTRQDPTRPRPGKGSNRPGRGLVFRCRAQSARAKAAASGIPQTAGRMVKSWSFCIGKPSFFLAYLPGRRLLQGFLRSSIMKMDPENSVSAFGSTTV